MRITHVGKVFAAFPIDGSCIRRAALIERTRLDRFYISRKVRVLLDDGLIYSYTPGCYRLTDEGMRLRQAHLGTEAVRFAGRRYCKADGGLPFSDRLWNAVRMERKGGIADFLRLASNESDGDPAKEARRLLKLWRRFGVVLRTSAKRPLRYCLIKDLGPRRPCMLEGRLFDPNARRFLEEVSP